MKNHDSHIKTIISNLSDGPGVYQMKDKDGVVLYVGKAKNLKRRVSSYFRDQQDLSPAKKQMVSQIADIDIVVCHTEIEALVLETNLIKHLAPKYNILMKDDKNLAYIKVTHSPISEILKTRQKINDGAKYFGPYVSSVEYSIRALKRIFRIRNCRIKFALRMNEKGIHQITIADKAGKSIPCMDYYIGICPAPCLLKSENIEQHKNNVNNMMTFLRGEDSEIFERLKNDMSQYASTQQFEKAQEVKELIGALEGICEKQKMRDYIDGDVDVCVLYEKYDNIYIGITRIRSGKIVGVFRRQILSGVDEHDSIIVSCLSQEYIDSHDLPERLFLDREVDDSIFHTFLTSLDITIEYPKIGPKKEIIEFMRNQLREYAYKSQLLTLENKTFTKDHMKNILSRLGYGFPDTGDIVFECYDISHTDGHFTYASRVVIKNGKPEPKSYKKYKIQALHDGQIDDFSSHREVMIRRTIEGLEYNNFPHLIIIDGGKGQLSSAIAGVEQGYSEWLKNHNERADPSLFPSLCSIAKREEEIFIPENPESILFEKGTPELMILQKARDESHRFSINANKSARMKSMKKNILEEIPGIGPITRKNILRIAKNIDNIRNIPLAQLQGICTIPQIQSLRDHGLF